ncbi:metallophosphoesterase [Sorangium sp. So ce406]|uniref:metallophosphoesterase n=1 Tax=Sorangium sp. So ce406 TaxID=3133311 RepID=UPI003F5B70FE
MTDRPARERLEALQRTIMTCWYSPFQLARSALDMTVSRLMGARGDFRLLEAIAGPQPPFDFAVRSGAARDELWLDYVADTGDGFNPTYAIASVLARPALSLGGRETRRGEVLIMGGDQVYPSATRQAYWTRLVEPYAAALPKAEVNEAPYLFAIPGNHDWYDGLTSFMRLFGQKRTLGAWKTLQSRSYFALKLPHGFWLLGVDIHLEADIDQPQIEYFCRLTRQEMRDGDRVVICTAEPDWVKGAIYNPDLQSNLAFFEKQLADARPGVEVVARVAGDLHHYRRHESADGRQNITAGGGGAFLHPTHGESVAEVRSGAGADQRRYALKASFPSESESRRLAWRNLLFARYNLGFWPVAAFVYMLSSLTLPKPGSGAVAWVLVVLLLFIFFTDTSRAWYRRLAGSLHAVAHLGAALGLTYLGGALLGVDVRHHASLWSLLGVTLFVGVTGAVVGSTLMGVYLLLSLNAARRHGNEAFSALRIEDYKNFLRIHVHPGGLTVYPVGLRKVPRAWKVAEDRKPGEPWFVPACGALEPELIEEPITIPVAPQHRRRDQPTTDAPVAGACERSASEPREPQQLSEPHEPREPQQLSEPQEPRVMHEPRSRPPVAGATADAGAPDP